VDKPVGAGLEIAGLEFESRETRRREEIRIAAGFCNIEERRTGERS